ncbi:MAG: PASTA domain-containing protein, partial [Angelakisella sp.]
KKTAKVVSKTALSSVLALLLGLSFVFNIALAIMLLQPRTVETLPSTSSELPAELMPYNFVGVYLKSVMADRGNYGDIALETEYAYNEDYPADIVYDQSVKIGEQMPEGRTVVLKVSRGSEYLTMPYLKGCSMNFASKTLTDMGINFEFVFDTNPESSGEMGTVTNCSKGFGTRITRGGEQVVITIKQPPSEVIEP